ncbi:ethylene-responsive transcription factor-like protein At4g13040 [Humulus lupulus]|uniref:ethylene-responsive transcription factor-like protein At4g13040 n=1 Tax=Humulus lupulus TaxID=3486 RepID=UPI002B4033D8|nr:ethylene-responsive transcription factor-like protein At4g13040 [Humulus lupulus]
MVSLRRRKLLGLCSGRNSFLTPLPRFSGNGKTPANSSLNTKSISVHPIYSDEIKPPDGNTSVKGGQGSTNVSDCGSLKEEHNQQVSGPPIKRRKRHRRKNFQNQEQCLMRGVYYKNMKWQAAIKVDKKQIHLGTVGSQEEAARLYDRAAFMCGREPNFELSEADKQELRQFKWEEFLAMTRHAITHKKHRRRIGTEPEKSPEPSPLQNDDSDSKNEENDLSGSEDVEADMSVS